MAETAKKKPVLTPAPALDGQTALFENAVPSDEALDRAAESFGLVLDARPKVKVRIPPDPLNPHDKAVPVCVNGFVCRIPRGKTVEVPDTVAELLANARYV